MDMYYSSEPEDFAAQAYVPLTRLFFGLLRHLFQVLLGLADWEKWTSAFSVEELPHMEHVGVGSEPSLRCDSLKGREHEPPANIFMNDMMGDDVPTLTTDDPGGASVDEVKVDEQPPDKHIGCLPLFPSVQEEECNVKSNSSLEERDEDWDAIRAIPHQAFVSLLLMCVNQTGVSRTCRVFCYKEGAYHRAAFLRITDDDVSQDYVVKVPAIGTPRLWKERDAHVLMCEAELMLLINSQPTVPVPEVIAYDTEFYNSIGAPFIMMKALPGQPAHTLWYDGGEDEENLWKTADFPTPKTEKFRINFLRSLAAMQAQLSTLTFDKIGMPYWDEDGMHVGHYFIGRSLGQSDDMEEDEYKFGPFTSTVDFFQANLEDIWPICPSADDASESVQSEAAAKGISIQDWSRGVRVILDIILSTPAFTSSKASPTDQSETFTLLHNDIDFQNLLVDVDGNITGFIDWDNTIAAPRSVACAAVPVFLGQDWTPHCIQQEKDAYLTFSLSHYRRVYATALKEFGCSDAKYTEKSPIYQATMAALFQGGDAMDLVGKLLRQIPELQRMKANFFVEAIGKGWPAMEKLLKEKISLLLQPDEELPTYEEGPSDEKPGSVEGSVPVEESESVKKPDSEGRPEPVEKQPPAIPRTSKSSIPELSVSTQTYMNNPNTSFSPKIPKFSVTPVQVLYSTPPAATVVQADRPKPSEPLKTPQSTRTEPVMRNHAEWNGSQTSLAGRLKRKLKFPSLRMRGKQIKV